MSNVKEKAVRRRNSRVCLTEGPGEIVFLPIGSVEPAPENEKLYAPIRATDPDVKALAASIRAKGVLEPLVISDDRFILSGNRRHKAARIVGLKTLPCRIVAVRREDDPDEFLRLLREHNRQRVKSRDEMLREEIVSVNPADAVRAVREHRAAAAQIEVTPLDLGARRFRKSISHVKRGMLEAAVRIIMEGRKFWPLSDRGIHYAMFNAAPLRNSRRPDSRYINDLLSYNDLCDLLTRARVAGEIPMGAIQDETRTTQEWNVCGNVADYVRDELKDFLFGYWRNLQAGQPNHVELLVEKNTVKSIVVNVAGDYAIPVTSGRGYCSLPPLAAMARRFKDSGKQTLVVLVVSDFDAEGENIPHALGHTLRDDLHVDALQVHKLALTAEQVRTMNLPPPMQAKKKSSRYKKFNALHGSKVYELESVPPEELQNITRAGIESVLDMDALAREREAEGADQSFLAVERARVMRLLKGDGDGGGDVPVGPFRGVPPGIGLDNP